MLGADGGSGKATRIAIDLSTVGTALGAHGLDGL